MHCAFPSGLERHYLEIVAVHMDKDPGVYAVGFEPEAGRIMHDGLDPSSTKDSF
jgi:hypothetical protein